MAVKLCTNCNLPFTQIRNEDQCTACTQKGDATFKRIKEYLYEHQGASASELVSNLGVSLKEIRQFLREDRLEVVGDGYSGLRCDKCDATIKSGRLCDACNREEDYRIKAENAASASHINRLKQGDGKAQPSIRIRDNRDKGNKR